MPRYFTLTALSVLVLTDLVSPFAFSLSEQKEDRPKYVDVTLEAGIHFRHSMGSAKLKNILQSTGAGVGFLDYDRDGFLDIYCVNGASLNPNHRDKSLTNRLYRNRGDGTFSDVTARSGTGNTGYGHGCLFGDYDNDGDTDIYVTNYGANVLYRNNGDGTFTDVTQTAGVAGRQWSTGAAFGDYDGDSDLDLYVTNYLDFRLDKKPRKSRLSAKEGYRFFPGPRDYEGQPDILYRNNGDGTFTDVTVAAGIYKPGGKGMQAVFTDTNNDGKPDIYVANDRTANFLFTNVGDGKFEETALLAGIAFDENGEETGAMGIGLGDYDGDGLVDLLVTNMVFEYNALYHNNGDGTFEDVTRAAHISKNTYRMVGWGTDLFDYDNDGDLDIILANGHVQDTIDLFSQSVTFAQPNLLFSNEGDGTFENVSRSSGKYFSRREVSRGLATGDYDNDGDTDILISNLDGPLVLLRNESRDRNHWVMIDVVGTRSNRDGVGAKVQVVSGTLTQRGEVRSSSSYLSQNDRRLKFGLGAREMVDTLEIRWPAGDVERFENLQVDRLYVIREGETIRPVQFPRR